VKVYKYLWISASEDGEPNSFLSEAGLEDALNELPHLVEPIEFLTEDDLLRKKGSEMYWDENEALLLKIEVIIPKPVKTVTKWSV
jgi:hypothetical protein